MCLSDEPETIYGGKKSIEAILSNTVSFRLSTSRKNTHPLECQPSSEATMFPVTVSHIRMLRSPDAEITYKPSGDNDNALTAARCDIKV